MENEMDRYVKGFKNLDLIYTYNKLGPSKVFEKIRDFVEHKREEILIAWWAEYGFAPGKAVMVHGFECGKSVCYIKESQNVSNEPCYMCKTWSQVESFSFCPKCGKSLKVPI